MKNNQITDHKNYWNKASRGWKNWNRFIMDWHGPIGKKIIELACIKPSDKILDIGTGGGEPGLTASSITKEGKVVGIDISEEMIRTANEFAKLRTVKNYEAILYDGYKIPFPDQTFDAAISRNGIMFSPDLNKSLLDVRRVLKSKGRLVISGWGPPENNESGHLMRKILFELADLDPVGVGEPGPYKFAEKGSLTNILTDLQLVEIRETDVYGTIKFDSFHHYWTFISETLIPVIESIEKYGPEFEKKIKAAVSEAVSPFNKNENLEFRWHAVIGSGQKK